VQHAERPGAVPTAPDEAAPQAGAGTGDWRDDELAAAWTSGDRLEELLTLPRRMTADLLAHADPEVRRILDVGSGPGAFLAAALARQPQAVGIWTDVSGAMCAIAQSRLAAVGERVTFRLADAADVAEVAAPGSLDAVLTSRMTHHLDAEGLATFYADAAGLLGPGGWIANIDHVELGEPWAGRLATARLDLIPPNPSPHRHDRPHPTLDDHLHALQRLDDVEVAVPWRAYATVLVLARRR
jgi:SAM-dependent methyltransferase